MVGMLRLRFPKVNFALLRNVLFIVVIITLSFGTGYLFGFKGFILESSQFPKVTITREVPPDKKDINFNLFWQVWDTLSAKYFDKEKLIPAQMVYGAIKGMVAAIGDPYTAYLPPEENKVVQEDLQGTFEGVGIQIGFKGNQLAVIAPLPGSPAERVGIEAGDFIIGIKDERRSVDRGTVGITLPEAVQAIRGPSGSKVTLTLLREGVEEPIVVEIVRETIDVPSVVVEYLKDDESIAHVKLLKFSGETLSEWEEAVVELLKRPNLKAVILDVRNNPGGFLNDAIELASDFLDTGETVVIEEGADAQRNEYRVEKLGRLRRVAVVVLINEGSASASEILAGSLKDNKRAQLVGETTFGKGTIQESLQVNGNGGLHITIARWLTPSGFWVNEGGLKPDVEVEDNQETEEDEQLQKAIEILSTNI